MLNRRSFLHPHDIFHILQPCIHMKLYWEDFQEQPEDQFISMPFWNVHASLRVAKCFPSIAVPCDTFDTNVALLQHLWEKSSQAERNNSENLARLLVCMQNAVFIQGLGAAASIQFEEELFTCIFDILLRTFCIWKSVHLAIILLFVHHVECFAFAMTVDIDTVSGVATRHSMQKQQVLAGFSDGVLNFTDAVQRPGVVGAPRNWRLRVQLAWPVNQCPKMRNVQVANWQSRETSCFAAWHEQLVSAKVTINKTTIHHSQGYRLAMETGC